MKKIEKFECEICNRIFINENEAIACEENHNKCICEKQGQFTIYNKVLAYAKSLYGIINFKKSFIKIYIDDDDSETYKKIIDIKYCPFCGKKLNQD